MLFVRAHFDDYNSYGILATELCKALLELGVDLSLLSQPGSSYQDSHYNKVPHFLEKYMVPYNTPTQSELIILPPRTAQSSNVSSPFAKRRLHLTMFESPILHPDWRDFENTCEGLILPCQGNVVGFHSSGIQVPMYTIPLGYDEKVYSYSPMDMEGPCVFGIGGRIHSITDKRKGVSEAVSLFRQAFPSEQDVRLEVKSFDIDEAVTNSSDSRIKFIRQNFTKQQLADWYKGLTAYLSMSKSEGWGLMQMDAMVTGRPIIGARFLGIKEFVPREAMFEVDWNTLRAQVHPSNYANPGCWAEPVPESVIAQMRKVYLYRRIAQEKGILSSRVTSPLTWKASAKALLAILKKHGYV